MNITLALILLSVLIGATPAANAKEADKEAGRCMLWVDVYTGESVSFDAMVEDCASSDVVYIGERHGLKRHHELERRLVEALAAKGKALILGIEQMEARYQPALDRYNRDEFDFYRLAVETDWAKRWSNYPDYRPVLEACKAAGGEVVALNADADVVRRVARVGLSALNERERSELPEEMDLSNREHERLLEMMLPVHIFSHGEALRQMYEAQISRDEKMADVLATRIKKERAEGRSTLSVVIGGAAHFSYGLGVPSRTGRRLPGLSSRIIILSESGDLSLGERQRMMARDTGITHESLKFLSRPIADYIHVIERQNETTND